MAFELDEETKQKIINLISALVSNAKIYLYGSRARGTNAQWSDIDLAIDAGEKLPELALGEIRDILDASNMPYIVDVIDLNALNKSHRDAILKEKIVWKE
jgi:predicted nucleotidyltransferase